MSEVADAFPAGPRPGLSRDEAERRLIAHGPNRLPEAPPAGWAKLFVRQFANPLAYLLLAALSVDLGLWLWEGAATVPAEAIAIFGILLLNAAFGAW